MTTILHIASSSNLHNSVSREIGTATVERLKEAHPDATVITRDLVQHPVPHIDPAFVGTMFTNHFLGRSTSTADQFHCMLQIIMGGILTDRGYAAWRKRDVIAKIDE